ncbi:hypothetical protein MRX96_004327 [Rhipicephalus microplus]
MRANREGVGLGESRHTSCCCDTLRPLCRDRLFRVQALHEQVCPVVTLSRNAIHLVARAENALPRWGARDRKVLERQCDFFERIGKRKGLTGSASLHFLRQQNSGKRNRDRNWR